MTNSQYPPVRDVARYGKPVHRFADLETFLEHTRFVPGAYQIGTGSYPIDFLLNTVEPGSPMVVNYHAALSGSSYTLPYFTGLQVTAGIRSTQLCVSDPSLGLSAELKLAWFVGHEGLDFQRVWRSVVDHVGRSVQASRELHFGASGGGFAALYFAHGSADRMAVAVNPQTSIAAYLAGPQRNFTRICFGAEDESAHADALRHRATTDLVELYSEPAHSTVVLIQNVQDPHMESHVLPFVSACHPANSVYANFHAWGPGHVPPPADFLKAVLRRLGGEHWPATLRDDNYVHGPSPEHVGELMARWRHSWV